MFVYQIIKGNKNSKYPCHRLDFMIDDVLMMIVMIGFVLTATVISKEIQVEIDEQERL